jgi:hypothetical protein
MNTSLGYSFKSPWWRSSIRLLSASQVRNQPGLWRATLHFCQGSWGCSLCLASRLETSEQDGSFPFQDSRKRRAQHPRFWKIEGFSRMTCINRVGLTMPQPLWWISSRLKFSSLRGSCHNNIIGLKELSNPWELPKLKSWNDGNMWWTVVTASHFTKCLWTRHRDF